MIQSLHGKLNPGLPWQKKKTAFNTKKTLFTRIFTEETSKVLRFEYSFVWCWNLDTSESRSEIPREFWNVVLEKDDDHGTNETVLQRVEEERNILQTIKRGKAVWIRSFLSRNCLLKRFIEGKMEGQKWWDEEEEDVSGYWVALRKREDTGNGKAKY